MQKINSLTYILKNHLKKCEAQPRKPGTPIRAPPRQGSEEGLGQGAQQPERGAPSAHLGHLPQTKRHIYKQKTNSCRFTPENFKDRR